MAPVVPYAISNLTVVPGTTFILGGNNRLTRCNFRRNSPKAFCTQSFFFPLSTTAGLLPNYGRWSSLQREPRFHILAATGTELAVEEPGSAIASNDAGESLEVPASSVEANQVPSSPADASVTPTPKSRSPRPIKRSDMPPVKNEELIPGATFTGKVRSVQPFGAFVDFGAFTDGLVHISNLSDTFVEDVKSVVSLGQEVKVRLVEVNTETKRISLTMREATDINQRKDTGNSEDRSRPSKKNTQKRNVPLKRSKFVKGQEVQGTVKNTIRAGSFISLPEDEEGFLPTSEESDEDLGNMMGGSTLQVGQEVSVRVLRIAKGKITLTMKKEEDADVMSKPIQGVVHTATNPFVLAFRKNKDIATYLDEREDMQRKQTESSVLPIPLEEVEVPTETKFEASAVQDQLTSTNGQQDLSVVDEVVEEDITLEEVNKEAAKLVENAFPDKSVNDVENPENAVADSQGADAINRSSHEKELSLQTSTPVEGVSSLIQVTEEVHVTDSVKVDGVASEPAVQLDGEQILSSEIVVEEEVVESKSDDSAVKDEVQEQQNEVPPLTQNEDEKAEDVSKNESSTASSAEVASPQESVTKASISPALVKQLREDTGAGMMDCKKALAETGGDIVQAQEFLRKKGLASADKKASRATAEGRIGSYIHDSRIGVLLEVNCETDFVSRGDIFKDLVDDLAMQVAACPQVQYLVTDDVPEDMVNKERELEMQKEDLLSKPEQIRSKIVEGRIRKRVEELALLEQPYIKNDKVIVKDWVKQTIATIGENIKVKRFTRYNLGEGLEKKNQDFAAEVAAQTTAKPSPAAPLTDQPAAVEAVKAAEKPPTVAISAALVKQLREETGAGMMDCKKALGETGGNLEKAQEYLRKKGLSTADKKSSRLAAEGRIGSYIHDARIGVLIEVNCETDFVGRGEQFKEMVDDLAMQVVACPQVQYVSVEDIPQSIVNKEKELEMQREDLQSKPENIREKIVEGRISKRLGELALLEQPFIKDDSLLVKDLVKRTVAALGENIKVRRFTRFTLGEVVDDAKIQIET